MNLISVGSCLLSLRLSTLILHGVVPIGTSNDLGYEFWSIYDFEFSFQNLVQDVLFVLPMAEQVVIIKPPEYLVNLNFAIIDEVVVLLD